MSSKLLAEFQVCLLLMSYFFIFFICSLFFTSSHQPKALTNMIMKVKRCEEEIEMKRRQVANLKMDSSDLEAIKKLKGLLL